MAAIAVLGYLMIFQRPLMWWVAAPPCLLQPPQEADAIVVFAGGGSRGRTVEATRNVCNMRGSCISRDTPETSSSPQGMPLSFMKRK